MVQLIKESKDLASAGFELISSQCMTVPKSIDKGTLTPNVGYEFNFLGIPDQGTVSGPDILTLLKRRGSIFISEIEFLSVTSLRYVIPPLGKRIILLNEENQDPLSLLFFPADGTKPTVGRETINKIFDEQYCFVEILL